MKKLLFAYDGSACAEAALDDLSLAGLPRELDVVVLSVAEVWLPANPDRLEPVYPDTVATAVRRTREQALREVDSSRALAERAAERLRANFPRWNIKAEAEGDSPAWALIKKADQWRADLVVVGSHGRSTLERLFLGSVSHKVAAEAHCSVRISRPRRHAKPGRLRVVVAVDGSADAQDVVRNVAGRPWPEVAEFRVVAVMDPRMETALAWPDLYGAPWVHERDIEVREGALRMIEHSSKQLFDAGLKTETHLLNGDPKHELLKHAEAWEADAIFVGARGLQHGGRLALGTVASAVASRAHCSVEIVRPPG